MLARLYEDAGVRRSRAIFIAAKDAKPNDPAVYTSSRRYYNQQGQFDKTIAALEQRAAKEPNNPEAFQTIATTTGIKPARTRASRTARRRTTCTRASSRSIARLQIKPDYAEAMIYKGLLLRLAGQPRKGPGQAAGFDQGSRSAARQGRRIARRRPPGHKRSLHFCRLD